MGDEEIMQAPRPGQSDIQRCIENAGAVLQHGAGMVEGQGLQKGLGRQARPAGEEPLQAVSGVMLARALPAPQARAGRASSR